MIKHKEIASMDKKQKGFSAVEGLLILVIIGIIGGLGWYLWNTGRKSDDTSNVTGNVNPPPKPAKPSNYKTYTYDQGFRLSFDYIPSWKVVASTDANQTCKITITSVGYSSGGSAGSESQSGAQFTICRVPIKAVTNIDALVPASAEDKKSLKVAGQDARQYIDRSDEVRLVTTFIYEMHRFDIIHKNPNYQIDKSYAPIYDHFLESFKFN